MALTRNPDYGMMLKIDMSAHIEGVAQGCATDKAVMDLCGIPYGGIHTYIISDISSGNVTLTTVPGKNFGPATSVVLPDELVATHFNEYLPRDMAGNEIALGSNLVLSDKEGKLAKGSVVGFGKFFHNGYGWLELEIKVDVGEKRVRVSTHPEKRFLLP